MKIDRGNTKFLSQITKKNETIEIDNIEIEKVEEYKYLWQSIAIEIEDRATYETQLRSSIIFFPLSRKSHFEEQ